MEETKMKKLFAITLTLCLLLGVMCSALADVPKEDYTPFAETVVLTSAKNDGFNFYGESDEWTSPEDNLWLDYIKDYLNVEIDYMWITENDATNYETKWNLAIADHDVPLVAGVNRATYEALYEAGLVADMTDAIEAYGSDYVKSMIAGSPEQAYMTREGRIWGVPDIRPSMDNYDMLVIRKDWMDKVGVEEVPKTIDGLIELGRKFVENGLGKYAMACSGVTTTTGWGGLQGLFQGYGIAWASGYWDVNPETGKLFYGLTDDRAADVLLKLQGLYKEGLIKEDFLVTPVAESINAGETGIVYSVCYGPVNTIDLFNLDPEADLISTEIPTIDGSDPKYYVNAVPNQLLFVSKDATEEQKKAIMAVWNLEQALWSDLHSDVDWGYHRNANAFAPADQYEDSHQYAKYYDEIAHAYLTGDLDSFVTANGKTYYERVKNYEAGDKTLAKYYPIYRVPNGTYDVINRVMKAERVFNNNYTAPATEFMQENQAMLDELLVNAANQVIMGEDISVWKNAVAEWYATGGQQMTDEANEWYEANK